MSEKRFLDKWKERREKNKETAQEQRLHQKEMNAGKKKHSLGIGRGTLIEYPNGIVEYRTRLKIGVMFAVNIREVTGFSLHTDVAVDTTFRPQLFSVQGSGTVLGSAPVTRATARKIEHWFRAHPDFGKHVKNSGKEIFSEPLSVADELMKLVGLRDSGLLTEEEFNTQKTRLLED